MARPEELLRDAWGLVDPEKVDTIEVRVLDELRTHFGAALAGRDRDGARHLLIPVKSNDSASVDLRSGGVRLFSRDLLEGRRTKRFVDLSCGLPQHERLFSIVAGDVLDHVVRGNGDVVEDASRALEAWRELIGRAMRRPDENELRGLFGELLVLRSLLQLDSSAAPGWCGPRGEPQDFASVGACLEVKTTSRFTRRVTIHGIDQLAASNNRKLYLGVLHVIAGDEGESLADVVKEVESLADPREPLLESLALAGVPDDRDTPQFQSRFQLANERYFPVTDTFPRLTRAELAGGDLPRGVDHVQYSVDLGATDIAILEPEHVLAMREELVTR